jgi:hypothetical protein
MLRLEGTSQEYNWSKEYGCKVDTRVGADEWTTPALGTTASNCGNEASGYTLSWHIARSLADEWQQTTGPTLPSDLLYDITPRNMSTMVGNGGQSVAHLNPGEQAIIEYSAPLHVFSAVFNLYDKVDTNNADTNNDEIWKLWVPGYVPGYNGDTISRAVNSIGTLFQNPRAAGYYTSVATFTALAAYPIKSDVVRTHVLTSQMTPEEYLKACGKPMPAAPNTPLRASGNLVPLPPSTTPTTSAPPAAPGASAAPIFPTSPPAGAPQPPSVVVTVTPSAQGDPADFYTVTSHPDSKTCVAAGGTQPPSCVLTGLHSRTRYYFTVVATNAGGSSPSSYTSNIVNTP